MKPGLDKLTKERRKSSSSPFRGLELRGKQRKEFAEGEGLKEPSAWEKRESLGKGEVSKDRISAEHRSWNMSRIRGKDTTPEMVVRSLLHKMGYRFRLHVRIPIPAPELKTQNSTLKTPTCFARPDLVLPKYKTALFVHGCFWHRHKGCKNCTTPSHRQEFWLAKLNGNAARDKLHQAALKKLGWRVIVIWECGTDEEALIRKFKKTLG